MITGNSQGLYRRTVLDSGVTIVTEAMPNIRSLAIGFWFDTGSRDEPEELAGIAHFIEHMNFKGTPRRSAASIARQIEGRGGHLNAFTSREYTCYYARIVDEQLSKAVDVLSDITQHSLFNPDEINKERKVILEELKNVEDTPDDLVFEHFFAQIFADHPMGRSVLGNRDTLNAINRDGLSDYRSMQYAGSRAVIAAAGSLDHNRIVRMIERRFNKNIAPDRERIKPSDNSVIPRQNHHASTQQAHIIRGYRAFPYNDPEKYTLLVLNTLLGGGMSSRLFQEIREKHGLAYTVYSFLDTHLDSGIFGIYAGTEPEQAEKTLKMITRELDKLVRFPVSEQTLKRVKDQLKGNLILGLESPGTRMHRLAKSVLYNADWLTLDDIVSLINNVSSDDIQRIARQLFDKQTSYTTVLLPN
jgi:predicted Zn-dependent peptidase